MATTTPNYGWNVPTSADYVAQGAVAIQTLGDEIDATVFGLPSGALALINTTTFSAVESQSVNNVFTSTYANYKIDLTITAKSVNSAVNLRYRVGGEDNSTGNYNYGATISRTSSAAAGNGGSNATLFPMLFSNAGFPAGGTYQIYSPQLSAVTLATYISMGGDTSTYLSLSGGCQFSANTVFDGFTVIAASGTIGGTIRVYGIGI